MRNKNNLKIKYVILLFLIIIFTTVVAFIYSYDMKEIYVDSYSIQDMNDKIYLLDDWELYNYEQESGKVKSISDDGQMVLRKLNSNVINVKIIFSTQRDEDYNVKIYYTDNNDYFSEEKSITQILDSKQKELIFELDSYVDNIRIDIGNEINQEFEIDKIVIESGQKEFSFIKFVKNIIDSCKNEMYLVRCAFLFVFFVFISLHVILDIKKMYSSIFRYRWIVGCIIVLLCTIFRIHGDSMTMYDEYVQTGQGSEFVQPVFGEARPIRSDEWVVDTPAIMSSAYGEDAYGKYNEVFRGGETLNMIDGINISYATIAKNPSWFVYKFLDKQRAFCFCWNFRIVFTFLISIELFYILTRKNKLYSVLGGCLVGLSPFYLWWNFPVFISGISAAIVCICYFLVARKKKIKVLYAIGVAISTANFIVNLYPAWQVPVAYIVIAFLIWIIHDYWRFIKGMDKVDWLLFFVALLFCITLVCSYFYEVQEYLTAITNTVYPGERRDSGGFILNKIMYYGQALFYAFKTPGNASETSVFFSLFPIPMFATCISFFKEKRKDWLVGGLLIVSFFLMIYCSVGLPELIARVTLMDYSVPARAVDILGYVNIILLVLFLGRMRNKSHCKIMTAGIIGCLLSGLSICICVVDESGYLDNKMIVISSILITLAVTCLIGNMQEHNRKKIWIVIMCVLCYMAIQIRPIMLGFDAFYSKPIAEAIAQVIEEDSDSCWLAVSDNIVIQSYAAACGAPTLNTVNYYPNMKMWEKIDPSGQYNEIYNRYAHISVQLVEEETSMELVHPDRIQLNLSYDDLKKVDVDYILSNTKLDSVESKISFENIYDEYGMYIYRVSY